MSPRRWSISASPLCTTIEHALRSDLEKTEQGLRAGLVDGNTASLRNEYDTERVDG